MSTPVDVWWAPPDAAAIDSPLLDDGELARCAAFRQPVDRARHATARVVAKRAVALRTGIPVERVRIVADTGSTAGRPRVQLPGDAEPPWISITHAGDAVGIALATRPCGLDVQDVAAIEPLIGSDLVYDAAERAELAALAPRQRRELACAWWVAKEAALKAAGCGLGEPMPLVPGGAARLVLDVTGRTIRLAREPVAAPSGHVAALAVQTDGRLEVHLRTLGGAFDDLAAAVPAGSPAA
jgi:4'-phosphopantetheinyl transferase